MKAWIKEILLTFGVTLAVWLVFSWPLPKDAGHAIASSAYNIEAGSRRAMIPGDHLQFLYQFWLAADAVSGHTPAFSNIYEFNTGNDAERFFPSTYYLPFSIFFVVGHAVGGQAVGWNFTGFVALWIAYFFTRRLLLRFTRQPGLSSVAAVISIILPYQWINLLDGSPTGLAMMWVPIVFWALDIMIADKKIWAGGVAGAALYLTEWGDTHVFFFTVLAAPFWCLFVYLYRFPGRWPSRKEIGLLFKAAILLFCFMGLIGAQSLKLKSNIQKKSTIGKAGRTIHEVSLRSPSLAGVVKFNNPGDSRKIYLGYYLLTLLLAGAMACAIRRRRQSEPFPILPVVLLGLALLGMVILSTGVKNPGGPRCWALLMKLVPPYGMIRQPDKIYLLMPAIMSLTVGMLLSCGLTGSARRKTWIALGLLAPLLLDYNARIRPTICLLDQEQGAYRAVAEDAQAAGQKPHIIALPLWPGDSHYTSLNEYYISLYRIRMINGYGGSVKTKYLNEVFLPFESMNLGACSDEQLDNLLSRGIGHIVLHEDVFPEKVSPFPVGLTLQRLLNHPRLQCIGKDATVWSFKILPTPSSREPVHFMKYVFPARRWEVERVTFTNTITQEDTTSLGDGYLPMTNREASVRVPEILAPLDEPLHWLVRTRGTGELNLATIMSGLTNPLPALSVSSSDWTWQSIQPPTEAAARPLGVVFTPRQGQVDLDSVLLANGAWESPEPGASIDLPAACFFHAGYTSREFDAVVFRRDYDPLAAVFYGPKLPLEPGQYTATVDFDAEAPAGTPLGEINARWPGNESAPGILLKAGQPAVLTISQLNNKPFFLAFRYDRTADMKIRSIRLTREK
ncbi:MAG TPA: hypothetical protein DCZ95_00110 [Verrucomicrobia bacterium]|nr:MAG: hypothetical protein A2X46_13690 [Lentisphaerae bacterium GWF2_57_35]HBA82473.1 hypothetical protein [Verrucomicrobiota bacterium]